MDLLGSFFGKSGTQPAASEGMSPAGAGSALVSATPYGMAAQTLVDLANSPNPTANATSASDLSGYVSGGSFVGTSESGISITTVIVLSVAGIAALFLLKMKH